MHEPLGDRDLPGLGERTLVMGVLNATDDSFSGDGVGGDVVELVELALRMSEEGADILDIGAASSRPGHTEMPEDLELARARAAVEAVRAAAVLPISIDTTRAAVADAALRAGATIVNDVSTLSDERLARVAADHGAWLLLVHTRPSARSRAERDAFPGVVVDETVASLGDAAGRARALGVHPDRILFDPGLGFRKTAAESFALVRDLARLRALGPVLVGPSRKAHLAVATDRPVLERTHATAAAVAISVLNGADAVRAHDVGPVVDAVRVADAVRRGVPAARSRVAYIALGANEHDARITLRRAVSALRSIGAVHAVSGLWRTAPMYVEDQSEFLNAVAAVRTRDGAAALVARLKRIERCLGRLPGLRHGPRVLDLDLVMYADSPTEERQGGIVVPHERFAERRFVLAPLAEIAPDERDPRTGLTVRQLEARVSGQAAERIAEGDAWAIG